MGWISKWSVHRYCYTGPSLQWTDRVNKLKHYGDAILGAIASQITNVTVVYSTVYSDADQRKHQSSASLAFVRRNHRGPVNSPHKWPATRKMFPPDDVTMAKKQLVTSYHCLWIFPLPQLNWCDSLCAKATQVWNDLLNLSSSRALTWVYNCMGISW